MHKRAEIALGDLGVIREMSVEEAMEAGRRHRLCRAIERLRDAATEPGAFGGEQKVVGAIAALASSVPDWADLHDLKTAMAKAATVVGAVGDWGYSTPEGSALRAVYDAWRDVLYPPVRPLPQSSIFNSQS